MSNDNPLAGGTSRHLVRNTAILSAVICAVLPVMGLWSCSRHGSAGWQAVLVAAGVCWFGSLLALLTASFASAANRGLVSVGAGLLFRMGLPLVVGTILTNSGSPLAEAGVFEMMLAFYFVTLIVETPLLMGLVRPLVPSGEIS